MGGGEVEPVPTVETFSKTTPDMSTATPTCGAKAVGPPEIVVALPKPDTDDELETETAGAFCFFPFLQKVIQKGT